MTNKIAISTLRQTLSYNPDNGIFLWKERPVELFNPPKQSPETKCKAWNKRHSGTPALTTNTNKGYLAGRMLGKTFKAHRVAWAIHYGDWPSGEIDHINGDKSDNRISNLRDVNGSKNCRNLSLRKTNSSGRTGVHSVRHRDGREAWAARITTEGKQVSLGWYDSIEGAIAAREAGEAKYGYNFRAN